MAAASDFLETQRYAVVTGSNKGIGFEICRQLASQGVVVVLTARDEKRGLEAVENLKRSGLSNNVMFHRLDVTNPSSIASLVEFVKERFGKLDILVNNAAVTGIIVATSALGDSEIDRAKRFLDLVNVSTQTYDSAAECLETNYYGAKRMVDALLPLLELSDSPRIVNVSSLAGLLKGVSNEWAIGVLSDIENLTEEKVDTVLNELLKDFKKGNLEAKGWPSSAAAYTLSKAALNAYTRLLAKSRPHFIINSVCPGFVKTDINYHSGYLSVEEGAESPVWLALLPKGGPSGVFFSRKEVSSF